MPFDTEWTACFDGSVQSWRTDKQTGTVIKNLPLLLPKYYHKIRV